MSGASGQLPPFLTHPVPYLDACHRGNLRGFVLAVPDGNTVRALVDLGFHSYQEVSLRLAGLPVETMRKLGDRAHPTLEQLALFRHILVRPRTSPIAARGGQSATWMADVLVTRAALIDSDTFDERSAGAPHVEALTARARINGVAWASLTAALLAAVELQEA